ncbi:MAG: deoxyuridine 5'-triphosphate nucleotidohydrolase [Clostridia bacterium]|nr:deoxyuridine 5'-triphosphate nucleotidohydrolase [Clostridia bacterium]
MTKFHKVSKEQFILGGGEESAYEQIKLPVRATKGSAGYDFFAPSDISLPAGKTVKVATGIRVQMDEGRVLAIFPRSGLGFKYKLSLDNTVGIIDSDYFGADNEGHIMIKMTNRSDMDLFVEKGKAFAQGIFLAYYLTDDDEASAVRTGGFGSTTK